MLEVYFVRYLAGVNSMHASERGASGDKYRMLTYLLWFGLEFIGGIVALIAGVNIWGVIAIAVLCGVVGGVISNFLAKNA